MLALVSRKMGETAPLRQPRDVSPSGSRGDTTTKPHGRSQLCIVTPDHALSNIITWRTDTFSKLNKLRIRPCLSRKKRRPPSRRSVLVSIIPLVTNFEAGRYVQSNAAAHQSVSPLDDATESPVPTARHPHRLLGLDLSSRTTSPDPFCHKVACLLCSRQDHSCYWEIERQPSKRMLEMKRQFFVQSGCVRACVYRMVKEKKTSRNQFRRVGGDHVIKSRTTDKVGDR